MQVKGFKVLLNTEALYYSFANNSLTITGA